MESENIHFFFEYDKNDIDNNKVDTYLDNMLQEFDQLECFEGIKGKEDGIFAEMQNYDLNCTFKQLVCIADYYGIKTARLKKVELIERIVEYEQKEENEKRVYQRRKWWYFMQELKEDKFMKQFVIW